jgi:hypothetical protein
MTFVVTANTVPMSFVCNVSTPGEAAAAAARVATAPINVTITDDTGAAYLATVANGTVVSFAVLNEGVA